MFMDENDEALNECMFFRLVTSSLSIDKSRGKGMKYWNSGGMEKYGDQDE